jgi:hypothetical protein
MKSNIFKAIKRTVITVTTVSILMTSTLFASEINMTDIQNHWGKSYIEVLVRKGAITGYPDGTFKPDNKISFAEFLKIAVSAVVDKEELKEIKGSELHWVTGIYDLAVEKGIITSTEFARTEEMFNSSITREDMALILIRLNEIVQNEEASDTTNTKNLINDINAVAKNREYYVLQAYQKGLITGKGNGFDAQGNTTRAEASTVIVRLTDVSKRAEVVKPVQLPTEDIYIKEGPYAGRVKTPVATEYDLHALKTARFTKEDGKYYFSITLPDLPDGLYWNVRLIIRDSDGNYMYSSSNKVFVGKEGEFQFEVAEINDSNINKVDSATIGVWVFTDKGDMVMHTLTNKAPNKVHQQSTISTSEKEWLDFDTTGIFNWK